MQGLGLGFATPRAHLLLGWHRGPEKNYSGALDKNEVQGFSLRLLNTVWGSCFLFEGLLRN